MPHLYVVCGHGAGDPGAGGFGYEEAERVRALGERIKELGGDSVTLLDTSRNFYADTKAGGGYWALDVPADACVVELHMDSAGEGARGAHVIVRGEPDAYDCALAEFVSGVFPGRANKLVSRTDLQNPNVCWRRGINYRLVENGFISDAGDLATFNANVDRIAQGYIDIFCNGAAPEPVAGEELDMTAQELEHLLIKYGPNYAWFNAEGENTAVGGNVYNAIMTAASNAMEANVKCDAIIEALGAPVEEIGKAVSEAVEAKLREIKLTLTAGSDV